MALTFQMLELRGTRDGKGRRHWTRTAAMSPILAMAGKALHEDDASIDEMTVAAGTLGWRVSSVDESADGACCLHLHRPSFGTPIQRIAT